MADLEHLTIDGTRYDIKDADLTEVVNQNTEDIAKNAEDIAANKENISKNAEDIATNAENISANTESISKNAEDIAGLDETKADKTDVEKNTEDIATNAENIAKNAEDIEALNSNLTDAFSEEKSYVAGDYCIYENVLYKFTADKEAGEWDESVVEQTNVGTEITEKENEIEQLNQSLVATKNGIFRGKYLGTVVTDAQWEAISNGTFDDLYIGDYWTINGYDWVIADFDYWWRCGDSGNALASHHIVIVPRCCISVDDTQMNSSNVTTGAYVGSAMYTSGLSNARSIIQTAFGSHLLSHRDYFQNAVTSGYPSGGEWVDSTVDLMNEEMVYGCPIRQQTSYGGTGVNNATISKSQLSLFKLDRTAIVAIGDGNGHGTTGTRYGYWLRDVYSASSFCAVNGNGLAGTSSASTSNGVRPAFGIY